MDGRRELFAKQIHAYVFTNNIGSETWTIMFRGRVCMTGLTWAEVQREVDALIELFA